MRTEEEIIGKVTEVWKEYYETSDPDEKARLEGVIATLYWVLKVI